MARRSRHETNQSYHGYDYNPLSKGAKFVMSCSKCGYYYPGKDSCRGCAVELKRAANEREWDEEHKNDASLCERTESWMSQGLTEDDAFAYACQDKQQNPYRSVSKHQVHCNLHGNIRGTEWDGHLVCPYHQYQMQTEEGIVLMHDDMDQDGNAL